MPVGGRTRRILECLPLGIACLFFLVFVALPLLVMLWETMAGPDGFDLQSYASILSDPVDRSQLRYSLELGLVATGLAFFFGCGHAFLTFRTDLPLASILGPLGVAPLIIPPILVAMGFADLMDAAGFWPCAFLLGVSYAPFVAVLSARGLRAIDGRLYEAALLARGRMAAERLLFRMALPEILAGCLFAFIFVISEHGVPEFLTVKGKTWHTYAEGIFSRWTRRATGMSHEDLVSPIVAALPLLAIIALALVLALRLRAKHSIKGDFQALPRRSLVIWRWPALLLPLSYLSLGVGVPVVVMARWAAGSTQVKVPPSLEIMRTSFGSALTEAGDDLLYTLVIGLATCLLLVVVAVPLARFAARRCRLVDHLCVIPIAVPAILLGMGMVHVFNSPRLASTYDVVGDFYDSWTLVACAYAARLLPFGVLTLSHSFRRLPQSLSDAARLSGRGAYACFWRIELPLLLPAIWSAGCLVFILALRELDMAVVLPAGNGTVVRRLSNIVHFGGEDMGGALALLLLLVAVLVPLVSVILSGRRLRPLS